MTVNRYVPKEVTDVDLAFGGRTDELLPPVEEIPTEFFDDNNLWSKQIFKWFYYGAKSFSVEGKKDIDEVEGIRHIAAILKSFKPKHEHKMAGCAFLASQFFDKFEIIQ